MKKFELSTAFLIGHEKIDSDHAELVVILNEMVDGFLKKDVDHCKTKWQSFCDRFKKHVQDEEIIMDEFGFFDQKHENTHQKVYEHVQSLGHGCDTLADWEACLYEMRNDVLTLILKHDLKFAEHLITVGYNDT